MAGTGGLTGMEDMRAHEQEQTQDKEQAADVEGKKCWERLEGEPAAAYHSFCLYRDFGPSRKIKKVLKLHELNEKKYGSWYRWSVQFEWVNRAAAFDDECEKERRILAVEEKRQYFEQYKKALGKAFEKVDRRLDGLRPEELSTAQTLDWLEKTYELGTKVHGKPVEDAENGNADGQLEINFFGGFDGV